MDRSYQREVLGPGRGLRPRAALVGQFWCCILLFVSETVLANGAQ